LKQLKLWIFSFTALVLPLIGQSATYSLLPQSPVRTQILGKKWAYTVPFEVKNAAAIQKLIQCESQGVNISRPDSDGIMSDGILQFHRSSKSASIGSGTWEWMESLSGLRGSPINPPDAIKMADWAISHGLGPHWTCWHLQHLDRS
jgi:hypothetical protein